MSSMGEGIAEGWNHTCRNHAWGCGHGIGVVVLWSLAALGCGTEEVAADPEGLGRLVEPPFAVRGEADNLLLVWFDEEGPHTATSRSEIPEEHRDMVRVDDLSLPPESRLDPDHVYVADLRSVAEDGNYPVRLMERSAFDRRLAEGSEEENAVAVPAGEASGVVIYGASWCGACRSTARYLRSRNVAFVERDVEREAGAREAMMRAARQAGVRPNGIPVIDFHGEVIQGFNQSALASAIERHQASSRAAL